MKGSICAELDLYLMFTYVTWQYSRLSYFDSAHVGSSFEHIGHLAYNVDYLMISATQN